MSEQSAAQPVWRSWLIIFISGGGALLSFLGGALAITTAGVGLATARIPGLQSQTLFNLAWASWLVGIFCIPAFVFSLREIRGKPLKTTGTRWYFLAASAGMVAWAAIVLIFKPVETSQLSLVFLPPLVVVATVLPLWWYLETGRRGLSLPSPSTGWGVISFSLIVTLPVILILELIVLVVALIVAGAYLSAQPGFTEMFTALQRMLSSPGFDFNSLAPLLENLSRQPAVLVGALVMISGIIPLLEEMFKPLAVWLLAGDRLTPAQGFYAGMLSGASFALWENLTALSTAGDGSGTAILAARVGTGLLHIVTAGMVSWGLASAWQSRRHIGRLIGAYLLAVLLHGLWNAAGLFTGIGPMLQVPVAAGSVAQTLETAALGVLIALVFINLLILLVANARLRPKPVNALVLEPSQVPSGPNPVNPPDRKDQ